MPSDDLADNFFNWFFISIMAIPFMIGMIEKILR
jgi:hypothetical protein